jgi:hypothetical protein
MTSVAERGWYVVKNDQQIGPIAEATLREFIQGQTIQPTDLIWRRGLQTWIVAKQLFEFAEEDDLGLKPPPLPKQWSAVSLAGEGLLPPPLPRDFAVSHRSQDTPSVAPEPRIPAATANILSQFATVIDSGNHVSSTTKTSNGRYLARHWRGQLSLPISFWFNGFLGYLVSTIAVALIGASSFLKTDFSPALSLSSMIGAWAITSVVLCWQVVGTWRAATEYTRRDDTAFWAAATKLCLCAATVLTLGQFANRGVPQIREMYSIYLGDEEVGKYAFRVLRDGAELEFSGGITFGAAKEFKRFIEAMGALKLVHLNSSGGRIEEAQRIGDLIKGRNLDTYVADSCLSACTIIFLSGKNRLITQNAKIGFHQPNFAGLTDNDRIELARKEGLRLQRFGLSPAFAKQATQAPPDQMWIPSPLQLVDERVATQIVESSSFALSGIAAADITEEKADDLLRSIPMYAAISNLDAASYKKIRIRVLDGLQRGKSAREMMTEVNPIVDKLFVAALPHASPTVLVEYTEMMIKHMKLLNRDDPASCYAYLNPRKDDDGLLATLGAKYPTLVDDQNRIKTKAFSSYQSQSDFGLSKDEINKSVAEILKSLESQFGRDVSLVSKDEVERSKYFSYCNVMAAFYEQILRLPSNKRTAVLRTLF